MNIENLTASEVRTIASIFNNTTTNDKPASAMPDDAPDNDKPTAAQPDTAGVAQKTEKIEQPAQPTAQTTAKVEQPGDTAAMQRALRSIVSIAEDAFRGPERDREANYDRALSAIADAARAALSAPPRNCDVGTPEDQCHRFDDYHVEHADFDAYDICKGCPLEKAYDCRITWMNLAYKEIPTTEQGLKDEH